MLEFFVDDFVIVAAVGVAGDAAVIGLESGLFVIIIGGEADDRTGAGQDLVEIAALFDFFHVSHVSVVLGFDPFVKRFQIMRLNFGRGKANQIKTQGLGKIYNLLLNMHSFQ